MRPHHNLIAWQEALHLVKRIYEISSRLPEQERYNLLSQIRRAAVSVPANIAEGAARNTKKQFLQFLYISSGSLSELETLILIARQLGFFSQDEANEMEKLNDKVSALLNGLIKSLHRKQNS